MNRNTWVFVVIIYNFILILIIVCFTIILQFNTVDPDWFKNSYRIIKPNEIFMELEKCAQQKPCSILVFDFGEKQLEFSKITRHAVIDDKVIFSQSIIYVRGVRCLDMGEVRSNMLQEIACHNSLDFLCWNKSG